MLRLCLVLFCVVLALALDVKDFRQELLTNEDFLKARDTCAQEMKLTMDAIMSLKKETTENEIPEQLLCFAKCVQEKRGLVEDGVLDMDAVENLPLFSYTTEDEKTSIIDCLKLVEKIETCQDMEKELKCFRDIAQKN